MGLSLTRRQGKLFSPCTTRKLFLFSRLLHSCPLHIPVPSLSSTFSDFHRHSPLPKGALLQFNFSFIATFLLPLALGSAANRARTFPPKKIKTKNKKPKGKSKKPENPKTKNPKPKRVEDISCWSKAEEVECRLVSKRSLIMCHMAHAKKLPLGLLSSSI